MVNKKQFTSQGDFLFVQPSEKIEFTNKGDQEYTIVLMELK